MPTTGLLSLVFTFISSILPNLASVFIEEKVKKSKLRKINSDLREYLLQRTSEYDFERLEDYLSSNGYSTQYEDDVLSNEILDAAVSDFFAKNPDVFYNKESLTPILKSAIQYAHSELYKTLSSEHRFLYDQNKRDHEVLKQDFNNFRKLIQELQQNPEKISVVTVRKLYNTALSSIKSGYINIANDLLGLLPEFNLTPESMPLYFALKIHIDYYLSAEINEIDLVRFANATPDDSTLQNVITFLFQICNYQMLKHLVPIVRNQNILDLIAIAISDNQPEAIRNRLTENLVVRPCYLEYEATFWYIANYQLNVLSYSSAEQHFQEISTKFPNVWADLLACQSRIQNYISQRVLIVYLNREVHDALEKELRNYLHFLFVYSGCNKSFVTAFWDVFLLAASTLKREIFLSLTKEYPSDLKAGSAFITANYENMLDNNVDLDISSFLSFCDATKNARLLLHYLAILADDQKHIEIIDTLKERSLFLKESIVIVDIYLHSIIKIEGLDEALGILNTLKEHYGEEFDFIVLEAAILDLRDDSRVDEVLRKAYDISLKPSYERMSLSAISKLAHLQYKHDRFEDAINLLDIYSKQSAPLLFEKLRMLMKRDESQDECSQIIEQLIHDGFSHPLVYQFRGILKEKKLVGSGLQDFEKAFRLEPSVQSAYSTLAIRIQVSKSSDDSVLDYACRSENPRLTCLAAQVYQKLHAPDLESFYILKALLELNNEYDPNIYGYFFMNSVQHESKSQIKPEKVQDNSVVTLGSLSGDISVSICFHSEAMLIPTRGSSFANCFHFNCTDNEYLKMKYKKVGDVITWQGLQYKITNIEDRKSYFSKHCINCMINNKDVLTINSSSPEELIDKMAKFEVERNQNIEQTLNDYYNSQFGLPLHTIGKRFGRTDFDVVRYLLFSDKPFMAGIYDLACNPPFILTLSSIYLLGFLGISNIPTTCNEVLLVTYFTVKKLEEECEEVCKSAEFTAGQLWADAESTHFLNYTDDIRASIHSHAADMKSLLDGCTIVEELNSEFYISELSPINENIGRDNYEAISYAKYKALALICDDLCIRRIANGFGVASTNIINVIILLDLGVEKVVEIVKTLLKLQYQFPITLILLNYLASEYDLLQEARESTRELSEQIAELFELVVDNQVCWRSFLNQTWMFARQDTPRNAEFTSLVFRFALAVSEKIDLLNQPSVLLDNPSEEI